MKSFVLGPTAGRGAEAQACPPPKPVPSGGGHAAGFLSGPGPRMARDRPGPGPLPATDVGSTPLCRACHAPCPSLGGPLGHIPTVSAGPVGPCEQGPRSSERCMRFSWAPPSALRPSPARFSQMERRAPDVAPLAHSHTLSLDPVAWLDPKVTWSLARSINIFALNPCARGSGEVVGKFFLCVIEKQCPE